VGKFRESAIKGQVGSTVELLVKDNDQH